MKNYQEINQQMEILKSLDKEIDKYDKKVNGNKRFRKIIIKMSSKKKS